MTVEEFKQKYNGKGVDFDGYYGDQCVDLFQFYNRDIVGAPVVGGNAIDIPNTYPKNFYTWIPNTPTNVPEPGDVIIWGAKVGPYGHIAIFLKGDATSFTSLDQNWPVGSIVHEQNHKYTEGVIGWLHPTKTQATQPSTTNMYKGYDLTNQDSMKVAVDVLVRVQAGEFVDIADLNSICATLGIPTGSSKDAINSAITKLQKEKTDDELSLSNVNKQIPELEGQISTLNNQVLDLTQKLSIAQNASLHPEGSSYQVLYDQAQQDLVEERQKTADATTKYNRAMGQYQNTSALLMDKWQLLRIVLARFLSLPMEVKKDGARTPSA